jgi:hypothetical protein
MALKADCKLNEAKLWLIINGLNLAQMPDKRICCKKLPTFPPHGQNNDFRSICCGVFCKQSLPQAPT